VPFLLSVGRLSAEKDFPTLLRALAMLRSRRPLRLLILGEGEKRSELESLTASLGINEDVSLPGFEVNPFQYMARCAAFVLSSTWEGFGNVLVEALACGAQIVSTDCPGGPREILAGGKYGLLVHPGDPTSMAAAVDYLLEHPLSRNRLRERAKDFTIEAILPQYLRLLFPEGLA
jgi:glycosyltransferase involved in cell wall biosynthesis